MELFKIYERYLYSICYSYTQNEQDSLDIVQEIYIKVFKNISSFDETMLFRPWIRRISINICINFKIISQLVAENCISEMEYTNIGLKIHNIIETYRVINKVITASSGAYKNNPYNNFINNKISATFNYIKMPINHNVILKILLKWYQK